MLVFAICMMIFLFVTLGMYVLYFRTPKESGNLKAVFRVFVVFRLLLMLVFLLLALIFSLPHYLKEKKIRKAKEIAWNRFNQQYVVCTRCGHIYSKEMNFCSHCGEKKNEEGEFLFSIDGKKEDLTFGNIFYGFYLLYRNKIFFFLDVFACMLVMCFTDFVF